MQLQIVGHELVTRITDIFGHLKWFSYIRCDVTLSFFKILLVVIFTASCTCLPWHSVHHPLPPVRKCNNVRDPYELLDFWYFWTAPSSLQLITKSGSTTPSEKKRRIGMIWGSIWLICELEWNGALLTMTLNSGADVSMYTHSSQANRMTFWIIHRDIN